MQFFYVEKRASYLGLHTKMISNLLSISGEVNPYLVSEHIDNLKINNFNINKMIKQTLFCNCKIEKKKHVIHGGMKCLIPDANKLCSSRKFNGHDMIQLEHTGNGTEIQLGNQLCTFLSQKFMFIDRLINCDTPKFIFSHRLINGINNIHLSSIHSFIHCCSFMAAKIRADKERGLQTVPLSC